MKRDLLKASALAAGGLLALVALEGCNKSPGGAAGASGDSSMASDQSGPNGYAPDGATAGSAAPAQETAAEPSSGRHEQRRSSGYSRASYYVDQPPPPIPEYDQPPSPGDGYYWTPGYWEWSDRSEDYYWVPGTWVEPPDPGSYWTPGYWAYVDGGYTWYAGYWGPTVGYYGGVDYGWGYNGRGYYGGRWQGRNFYYNSAANNFNNSRITNVYRENVENWTHNRTSYSGGPGGLRVAPTPEQVSAIRAPHVAPTSGQLAQREAAQRDPRLAAHANQGRPPVVATVRPGAFEGPGTVTDVRSAPHYTPPAQIHASAAPPRPQGPQGRPGESPTGGPAAGPENRSAAVRPETGAPHGEARPGAGPPGRPATPEIRPGEPRVEARPETQPPHPAESRGAPPARPAEPHAAPAAHPIEARSPARAVEPHAAPISRPVESRPAPPPRPVEARPAPAPRPEQAHPAPQGHGGEPHPEGRPADRRDEPR